MKAHASHVIRSIREISGDVGYPPGVEIALHTLHPQFFTVLPASLGKEAHGQNGSHGYGAARIQLPAVLF